MGRLTTAQETAIQTGAPTKQVWTMLVPVSAHTSFTSTVFATASVEDGDLSSVRVTRAGSRSHKVWNPSPNVKKTPKAARYTFTVSNEDGFFYDNTVPNVFKPSSYQATRQECIVRHQVYVGIRGNGGAWAWSEITHMAFEGQIVDIDYNDGSDENGDPYPIDATIITEQVGAWASLRRDWVVEDATDVPMTGTAAPFFDYTWTIP